MGWPDERFVGPQLKRRFLCLGCNLVVENPRKLHPCWHVYCKACLPHTNRVDYFLCCTNSPAFGRPLDLPTEYMDELNSLRMRCAYADRGCQVDDCTYGNHDEHEKNCKYKPENEPPAPPPSSVSSDYQGKLTSPF